MTGKKWFWGLFFILAGGAFLANSLELFTTHINFWSLLLTVGLLAIIIGSILHFNFTGILVPLSIIGVIFAEDLGITAITPWPIIITAVLLSIGLDIIFSKKNTVRLGVHVGSDSFDTTIVDEEDSEEINYQVSFGSGVKYVNTNNLKKARFSCKFGALKVYFDNAKPSKNGAEIILDVAFGGAEIYIPKSWNVAVETLAMLGGVEERRHKEATEGPKVVIKGNVSLGGVEIIYI